MSDKFRVSVQKMVESHQETYWVCLDRPDRPLDAKPWDAGRLTPYYSKHEDRANYEAACWEAFLNGGTVPDDE